MCGNFSGGPSICLHVCTIYGEHLDSVFLEFDLIHLDSMMLIRLWWLKVKVTVRNALREFLPNRYKGPYRLEHKVVRFGHQRFRS